MIPLFTVFDLNGVHGFGSVRVESSTFETTKNDRPTHPTCCDVCKDFETSDHACWDIGLTGPHIACRPGQNGRWQSGNWSLWVLVYETDLRDSITTNSDSSCQTKFERIFRKSLPYPQFNAKCLHQSISNVLWLQKCDSTKWAIWLRRCLSDGPESWTRNLSLNSHSSVCHISVLENLGGLWFRTGPISLFVTLILFSSGEQWGTHFEPFDLSSTFTRSIISPGIIRFSCFEWFQLR
jgi:hypothetical protein